MATPKFKAGDNVKILNGSGIGGIAFVAGMEALSGRIDEVSEVDVVAENRVFYRLKNTKYWWHESILELVKDEHENKIVITTDGTTTRAVWYDGRKPIKESKVVCYKEDTFDFAIGAKLVFDRLMQMDTEAKTKKALKPLNTRIFVLDGDEIFKTGHIYAIKDGRMETSIGTYPMNGKLYCMEDVVKYFTPMCLRKKEDMYNSKGEDLSVYDFRHQINVREVEG